MQAAHSTLAGQALDFDPCRRTAPWSPAFGPAPRREGVKLPAAGPASASVMDMATPRPFQLFASGRGESTPASATLGPAHDDDALMCRVQAGELQVLSLLFERYQTALLNFYLSMLGDRAASEDLVQEVFVRILKYRRTYRPGSRFTTWMYSIARNARLDFLRKRAGQGIELEWDDIYAPAVEPGDAVELEQHRRLLALALARLPDAKREVLVLSRFQELRYDEIGELLDCEPATIKVRVHRAMQELRQTFQQLAQGDDV